MLIIWVCPKILICLFEGFRFIIRDPLRNPMFGNILMALYKEISLIVKVFFVSDGVLNFILGPHFEIYFLAIY